MSVWYSPLSLKFKYLMIWWLTKCNFGIWIMQIINMYRENTQSWYHQFKPQHICVAVQSQDLDFQRHISLSFFLIAHVVVNLNITRSRPQWSLIELPIPDRNAYTYPWKSNISDSLKWITQTNNGFVLKQMVQIDESSPIPYKRPPTFSSWNIFRILICISEISGRVLQVQVVRIPDNRILFPDIFGYIIIIYSILKVCVWDERERERERENKNVYNNTTK